MHLSKLWEIMIRQPFYCYNSINWAITRHAQHFSWHCCRDDMSSFLAMSQKKFHFYQYCLISVIMLDDMSSKFLGRTTLSFDMSSKFLGRTTCHLHFSVRHHVAQNVVHDDILLILTTCRNICPKFTIFHDFMSWLF